MKLVFSLLFYFVFHVFESNCSNNVDYDIDYESYYENEKKVQTDFKLNKMDILKSPCFTLNDIRDTDEFIRLQTLNGRINICDEELDFSQNKYNPIVSVFNNLTLEILVFNNVKFLSAIPSTAFRNSRIELLEFVECEFALLKKNIQKYNDSYKYREVNASIKAIQFSYLKNSFKESFLGKELYKDIYHLMFKETIIDEESKTFSSNISTRPLYIEIDYSNWENKSLKWMESLNAEKPIPKDADVIRQSDVIYLKFITPSFKDPFRNSEIFKYFPDKNLVIPVIVSTSNNDSIDCNCDIMSLFKNFRLFRDLYYTLSTDSKNIENIGYLESCLIDEESINRYKYECDPEEYPNYNFDEKKENLPSNYYPDQTQNQLPIPFKKLDNKTFSNRIFKNDSDFNFHNLNLKSLIFINVEFMYNIPSSSFKNSLIQKLEFINCKFNESLIVDDGINENVFIRSINISGIKNGFKDTYISKSLLKNVKYLKFYDTPIKSISDNFTAYFQIRPLYFSFQCSLGNSTSFKWMQYLNKEKMNCNLTSNSKFANSIFFEILDLTSIIFDDKNLCKFKYIPNNQHIIPTFSNNEFDYRYVHSINCSCTIYWIFKNIESYFGSSYNLFWSSVDERTRDFTYKIYESCFYEKNAKSMIDYCKYKEQFKNCKNSTYPIANLKFTSKLIRKKEIRKKYEKNNFYLYITSTGLLMLGSIISFSIQIYTRNMISRAKKMKPETRQETIQLPLQNNNMFIRSNGSRGEYIYTAKIHNYLYSSNKFKNNEDVSNEYYYIVDDQLNTTYYM